MKSVLLVSHGSHSHKTKEEVAFLTEVLKKKSGIPIFKFAFLEIESPSIPEGIEGCVNSGANEIIILLNFLNSGKHVDEDIPRIVRQTSEKYPNVNIRITGPVGQHQRIPELFLDMIKTS